MVIRQTFFMFFAALSLCGCGTNPAIRSTANGSEPAGRDASVLFERGRHAAAQGDTLRAEQYLSMARDRGFDDRKILPILLHICLSSSRLRAALTHAEPHLSRHPNDKSLRYLVAVIHLGLGQFHEARINLGYLLRLDPVDANAHYLSGVLEASTDPDRARMHFRRYLELAPEGAHAVEVRSRLTDLEIRADLKETILARGIAPTHERVVPALMHTNDVGWFDTEQPAPVSPKTGAP